MHHIHNGKVPSYLADIVTATSDMESRSVLRSASNDQYEIPGHASDSMNTDSPLLVQEHGTFYLHVSVRSDLLRHLKDNI